MTNGISQEIKNMLNDLDKFVAFDNLWGNIKKSYQPATNPKFGIKSKIVIPNVSTYLVVADICRCNNVNVYLLEYECNNAYKLIISEDCISHVQ